MIKISDDINHQGENTLAHIANPLRVRERLTSSAAGIDSSTLDPLKCTRPNHGHWQIGF